MIKNIKKIICIIVIFFFYTLNSAFADTSHFMDFTKVLNSSKAGAQAQKKLQTRLQTETKKFNKIQEDIRKEEADIISQKKLLSPEDYQKKVQDLRKKVSDLQKNKQKSFNNIAKSRSEAKQALIKAVNPIIKKYMEENKIRIVYDKQSIILGDTKLEITDQIIAILNKESPSLKMN